MDLRTFIWLSRSRIEVLSKISSFFILFWPLFTFLGLFYDVMLDRFLTLSLFKGFIHCTLPISAGSVTGTLADCEGSQEVKSGTLIIGRFSFKHVFFWSRFLIF